MLSDDSTWSAIVCLRARTTHRATEQKAKSSAPEPLNSTCVLQRIVSSIPASVMTLIRMSLGAAAGCCPGPPGTRGSGESDIECERRGLWESNRRIHMSFREQAECSIITSLQVKQARHLTQPQHRRQPTMLLQLTVLDLRCTAESISSCKGMHQWLFALACVTSVE